MRISICPRARRRASPRWPRSERQAKYSRQEAASLAYGRGGLLYSNVEEQDAEPLSEAQELSEAQKAARDADLDARLERN